ncbi:(2Fe-2S)-binding protein [Bacillus spongiae]|uniref:(2Fe-2S)-binding protein n=1 Tax=Bacillus spongiae TaxID=2683610 RepID=A0ABU8HJC0_9BACI
MITKLTVNINGQISEAVVRMAETLLETLREQYGLTGAKRGCENGDCGSCTVLIDNIPIKSCMLLTVETREKKIVTIEGLHNTPIQQAFLEKWAFQCGYCTSGFIMNAHSLIHHHPDADDERIEDWLGSNLCRCTSYQEIKEAVSSVLKKNHDRS